MLFRQLILWIMCLVFSLSVQADATIAIIIDDMGHKYRYGDNMLKLPGDVTYAFLPHTPFGKKLANLAHTRGKEVMLHMPMQAYSNFKLGVGGLTLALNEKTFNQRVKDNLDAIPYIVGVNNHMGSRLTQDTPSMQRVMRQIKQRKGLYFVDSLTTRESVAYQVAKNYHIPAAKRDVFLDNKQNTTYIRQQFRKLIYHAKKYGHATAIGHPYRETWLVLREEIAKLPAGITLIPMSQMIASQQRKKSWQKHSSPLLKVAKNSKP